MEIFLKSQNILGIHLLHLSIITEHKLLVLDPSVDSRKASFKRDYSHPKLRLQNYLCKQPLAIDYVSVGILNNSFRWIK